MKDVFNRILQAGLGAASITKEKAEQIVDELIKRGEISQNEAKDYIDTLVEKGKQQQSELQGIVKKEVDKYQAQFSFVSRKEFAELEKRVALLEGMLSVQKEDAKQGAKTESVQEQLDIEP
jgi:polyhydroxyalkanoate synthesis regulator phasin